MRGLLRWVKEEYNDPLIIITENGYAGPFNSPLEDQNRINFHQRYLEEMLKAIYFDDCKVIGYFVWSLLDNFEWAQGYSIRFGLNQVNFNSSERTRTPRKSASYFRELIATKKLPNPNKSFPPIE
uniref:Uncharacterized protein n=2 Tax=Clastoptera arizonana TaxID=38151 RepID=A0A1B6E4G4_9HEMI